jgi:purine catabolism regulator
MLDGADVPRILAVLADAIDNPVVLEKADYGVLYHAPHDSSTPDVLAAWEVSRGTGEASARAEQGAVVYPVFAAGHRTWGHLVALPLESVLDDFDREAIERAVTLIALELLRSREEALLIARERGDLLAEIAAGRLDLRDAAATAQKLGFDFRRGLLVPLVIAPANSGRAESGEVEWVPVLRALREELSARAIPALIGSAGSDGGAVVLLAIGDPARREATVGLCAELVRAAAQRHLGSSHGVVIAAGSASAGWDELPAALRQTTETAALARSGPARAWHDATIPDVGRLLGSFSKDSRLREFVDQRLGCVITHDQRRAAKLMPTLEALSSNGWRRAETARALHLNRQSLYPRLERLERLLGSSLDDPDTRLGIDLALRVRRS